MHPYKKQQNDPNIYIYHDELLPDYQTLNRQTRSQTKIFKKQKSNIANNIKTKKKIHKNK